MTPRLHFPHQTFVRSSLRVSVGMAFQSLAAGEVNLGSDSMGTRLRSYGFGKRHYRSAARAQPLFRARMRTLLPDHAETARTTMNTQERRQLIQFLQQLIQAQVAQKDSEADTLIRDACGRQNDAAYLLVQRAMLLEQAMQTSEAQISSLQRELEQLRGQTRGNSSGSFLDPNAWGSSPAARPLSIPQTQVSPSPQAPVATSTAAPAPSAWGSGMLGNIATTAAGAVAGGFLFQGIGHLLGNHGSNAASMNGLSSNVPAEHHEATTIAPLIDDSGSSAGLFDTSSVDGFIADDTDNSA